MISKQEQHELNKSQFGPSAAQYATSTVHADPDALAELVEWADPKPTDSLLDIATGSGNTALAFAPHVARAVGLDLTPAMLGELRRLADERGLDNVETIEAPAEEIPFPDATFDIVTARLAPHHFADIKKAVSEMARVTKQGGQVLVHDTTSPEDQDLDRQLNEIEILRDPGHIRNYAPTEWKTMFEDSGLEVTRLETRSYGENQTLDLDDWTKRLRTPENHVVEIRHRFRNASPGLKELMDIQEKPDGKFSFVLPRVNVLGRKR